MSNIKNYQDLLEEKKHLEELLQIQKSNIHTHLAELKEEYKPAINLLSSLNRITSRDRSNPLINVGINLAGEFLQKNIPLVSSNRIVQFSVPFIAKKALTFALSKGISHFLKLRERWKARVSVN